MPHAAPPPLDALLAHTEWVRALARSLVRDPDTADEIAQRALLAAWRTPPRDEGSLRAWLRRTLERGAASARRASARRVVYEQHAARDEELPSALDVVARASLQRELVEAVLALDEPYRTAILLRYFDELEPAEIARKLEVPSATVRTHVARGLARLRERLDRSHGDRAAWTASFLPLALPAEPSLPLSTLSLMNFKLKLALPLVVVGALAWLWIAVRPDGAATNARGQSEALAALAEPRDDAPRESELVASPASTPRVASAPVEAAKSQNIVASSPAAPRPPRGFVLDAAGEPRSHFAIAATSADGAELARATSDDAGRFTFATALAPCRIASVDRAFATVLAASHGDRPDEGDLVVVVAETRALTGQVIDEANAPIADVKVEVVLPADFRARFRHALDRSLAMGCEARSDARGAFALESAPLVDGALLSVLHDGYEPWTSERASVLGSITITLRRPRVHEDVVQGRVVDFAGSPIAEVRVSFGADSTKTTDDGGFRFVRDDPNSMNARIGVVGKRLIAAKKGFLPAQFDAPLTAGKPTFPAFVTLKIGAPTLSIAGRVEVAEGASRAGIQVWIADSTTFGAIDGDPVQLESVLAGVEDRGWRFVETDEDGRFEIDGLLDRAYTVEAIDGETLLRAVEKDVAAGTQALVVRFPKDALFPRVAGRVLAHDGSPIVGASVKPMCDAFRARFEGETISTNHMGLPGVATDAEGRFELVHVPRTLVYLRVDGESLLPLEYGRFVEGDRRFANAPVKELPRTTIEALEIVVDRRAHVQIELADASAADQFALLDERGEMLELSAFEASGRSEGPLQPIVAGRSVVVAGTDRAKALVLFKSGVEVARTSIRLVPGETKLVRL